MICLWFNRKLVQRKFLAGRWEGTLVCTFSPSGTGLDYIIDCTLVVTSHKGKDCKAYWYYEGKKNSADRKISRGVDKLINYSSDFLFFRKKLWNPKFVRLIHDDVRPGLKNNKALIYNWECKVCDYWWKEKMEVKIKGEDIVFSGFLQKI
jgi:hypothetical protein